MRRGDFARAWKISDALLATKRDENLPRRFQSVWDGRSVVGKRVLVRCYHGLGVGLIWQSGDWDNRRSIPFSLLKRLGQLHGVEWHILQRDAARAGWDGSLGYVSGGDNPLDDARIMRALDLVISVDTMTAHLAGALGVNTWTLLPFEPDWRWMLDRPDSPWYPTMRLFRQREEGNWPQVINELLTNLQNAVARGLAPAVCRVLL